MAQPLRNLALSAALAAALAPASTPAASLDADGLGQALIYPYYTARASGGNAFNTYITLVNHTADAKAVRVRFREGRNARSVLTFNLFLSRNDAWAAAIVPDAATGGTRLSAGPDTSCIGAEPVVNRPYELPFVSTFYSAPFDDLAGGGLDRTREGFVEVIEMATLTGATAAAVTHQGLGLPPGNCLVVQGTSSIETAPRTGGLSGTVTLINVNNGMDFAVDATALADLGTNAFYRPAVDPYPDLNAVEIPPVSVVTANGVTYRSTWNRAVDAVSAVLMRTTPMVETIFDPQTRSNTDVVITYPTKSFYVTGSSFAAPFYRPFSWPADSCSDAAFPSPNILGFMPHPNVYDREQRLIGEASGRGSSNGPRPTCDAAAAVHDFTDGRASPALLLRSGVFGSANRAFARAPLRTELKSGWVDLMVGDFENTGPQPFVSLSNSMRVVITTGETNFGNHTYTGMPMIGFAARTFENGALSCTSVAGQPSGGICQGNYGGSFPVKFRRAISP